MSYEYLAMSPPEVNATVTALGRTGTHLRNTWRTSVSAIDGAESGIGSDALGRAFRSSYEPDSVTLRREASRLCDAIEEDGRVGRRCADLYLLSDLESRHTIDQVRIRPV